TVRRWRPSASLSSARPEAARARNSSRESGFLASRTEASMAAENSAAADALANHAALLANPREEAFISCRKKTSGGTHAVVVESLTACLRRAVDTGVGRKRCARASR